MLTDRDYGTVFEASPDATLVVDSEPVIRDLNPQALSMFGWSREEMEGSGVERQVPVAGRRRLRPRYAEASRPMEQGLPVEAGLSPAHRHQDRNS